MFNINKNSLKTKSVAYKWSLQTNQFLYYLIQAPIYQAPIYHAPTYQAPIYNAPRNGFRIYLKESCYRFEKIDFINLSQKDFLSNIVCSSTKCVFIYYNFPISIPDTSLQHKSNDVILSCRAFLFVE